jgi:hypothetical protein
VSDTDTAVVKSLKVLDPNRPIREADIRETVELMSACEAKSGHPAALLPSPLLTQSGHREDHRRVRERFDLHQCENVSFPLFG